MHSARAGFITRLTRLQTRAPIFRGPLGASFSGPCATSFTVTVLKFTSATIFIKLASAQHMQFHSELLWGRVGVYLCP